MKYYYSVLIIMCFCITTSAQKKLTYTGSLEGGLLIGDVPGGSGFVSVTSGVSFKKFSLVLGTGYDSYRFTSMPIFVEFRKSFTQKKIQPFLQFAAGINVDALTDKDKAKAYNYGGKYQDGFYTKLGGGLIFNAKERFRFMVNAGYSYKTVNYKYHYTGIQPYDFNLTESYYRLNRWYFGVGFMW